MRDAGAGKLRGRHGRYMNKDKLSSAAANGGPRSGTTRKGKRRGPSGIDGLSRDEYTNRISGNRSPSKFDRPEDDVSIGEDITSPQAPIGQ